MRATSRLLPLMVLAVGCGPSELSWSSDIVGCENYDFDNPGEADLDVQVEGSTVTAALTQSLQPADAQFDPQVSIARNSVEIREFWSEGEEDDFCFSPRVIFDGASRGKFQVFWFVGDADLAYDNVTVEVD